MSTVGIEDMTFAIPKYYISAKELADFRGIDPNKYTDGLGIKRISVLKDQNLIQLSSKSLNDLLIRNKIDPEDISRIYVATESSIDESKSLAEFIIEQSEKDFGYDSFSHIEPPLECKQACISSSAVLNDLCRYTKDTGNLSILLCVDEAKYPLGSPGEPTQGCAACAMLIKRNPSLVELNFDGIGCYNKPADDFYRPTNHKYPIVDGHYSNYIYLYIMRHAYDDFVNKNSKNIDDFDYFVFHLPYPKMAFYSTASLLIHHLRNSKKWTKIQRDVGDEPQLSKEGGSLENMKVSGDYIKKYFEFNKKFRDTDEFKSFFDKKVKSSLRNSVYIGNVYTASIFLCLASLIEEGKIKENSKIGFGGFGSGASAMVYSGVIKEGRNLELGEQIVYRDKLSIESYEILRSKL